MTQTPSPRGLHTHETALSPFPQAEPRLLHDACHAHSCNDCNAIRRKRNPLRGPESQPITMFTCVRLRTIAQGRYLQHISAKDTVSSTNKHIPHPCIIESKGPGVWTIWTSPTPAPQAPEPQQKMGLRTPFSSSVFHSDTARSPQLSYIAVTAFSSTSRIRSAPVDLRQQSREIDYDMSVSESAPEPDVHCQEQDGAAMPIGQKQASGVVPGA